MKRLLTLLSRVCIAFALIRSGYAGNIVLTGHDDDFHRSEGAVAHMSAMLAFVREGAPDPKLPVLTFDHGTQLTSLLASMEIPFVNVDPDAGVPPASLFNVARFSAIIVASQGTCSDCGNTVTSAANLAAAQSSFGIFLNAGGGILGLSGAGVANAYAYLPGSSGAVQFGSAPLTGYVQTAFGAGIGIPAVNGDSTHNYFNAPGSGGTAAIYGVVESNLTMADNPAVTIAAKNATTDVLVSRPTLTSILPNSAVRGDAVTSISLAGTDFVGGSTTVAVSGSGITVTGVKVSSPTSLTVTLTIAADAALGSRDVTVTTSGQTSNAVAFIVSPVVPTVSYGLPTTLMPTQQQSLQLTIGAASPDTISGRLDVTLLPNAVINADDPNVRFSNGQRSVTFSIPAGSTTAQFSPANVLLMAGTVAGTIRLTLNAVQVGGVNVTPASPTFDVSVPQLAPIITNVRILNKTAVGFEVEVTGYSNSRQVTQASFTFTASSGSNLQTTSLLPAVDSSFTSYFQTASAAAVGSQFTYVQPFTVSGDVSAIASVSVTLTNSQGVSASRTAN